MGVSVSVGRAVSVGGGGVKVLVAGGGANGRGADGSCNRMREKAAIRSTTPARPNKRSWVEVRFLFIAFPKA